ncbi:MAG: sigma-70 family RNA polymerase sigma factor [Bacteriovoracaceae bacterium]|nr:sigma-70 family RNA polymerase sigma factor [Bacteriovoracaceae bacterium]
MSDKNQDLSPIEIIDAFKNQDWSILEQLIKQYTTFLLKSALGLGVRGNEADDLVQNVWSTFFEVIDRFEGNSQIRTFLYGILINKTRELRRENIKSNRHDPIDSVMEERFDSNGHWAKPPMNPEQFLEATQTLEIISDCIDKLPVTQRAAFTLWEIDESETSEICKILDVTVTNLGVILYRAKNRLRECIEIKTKANE